MQNTQLVSKIGQLREQKRLTQRELSQQIGVTESTIANWEKGRSGLDLIWKLTRLCEILDCKLDEQFVSNIGRFREQKHLTQRDLSQLIGVTENTIANWEKGRSGLDLIWKLIKLCNILGCDLGDLLESPLGKVPEVRKKGRPFSEIRKRYHADDRSESDKTDINTG